MIADRLAHAILRPLLHHRRLLTSAPCSASPCASCFAPHEEKVREAIRAGRPIRMVLPAFPAKSPNPKKVLSALPDEGERIALSFLRDLCRSIAEVYAPGAKITLCADGRVFSDVVQVRDEDVSAYMQALAALIEEIGAGDCIEVFTLDQELPGGDFDEMRQELLREHGRPPGELREQVRDGSMRSLFNGIARFMFEDLIVLRPDLSRNQAREQGKALAYEVIRRSAAWTTLVAARFPEAIRLSIHPQPHHSDKLGIHLIHTADSWLTPWHGVAVRIGERSVLMKRHEAERLGARLVHRGPRPSHFVLPEAAAPAMMSGEAQVAA
jgi:pyoverdine/dityrosine biosynthesis protein Dit1